MPTAQGAAADGQWVSLGAVALSPQSTVARAAAKARISSSE
jgi:hypothetical protein